ncbi:MAG: TonB-dependent receptor [Pseudomonadota bacterium]
MGGFNREMTMTSHRFAGRTILFAGASVIAITAAPHVSAQDEGLDTIIVTTQKREENQQEIPISVETVSSERLAAILAGGEDILALAARVPSLYAESSNGRLAPRFYIRGLGNVDFDVAASQPVSIVVDDIVQENVVLKSAPLFDLQQVEVSRGPQGTLFGRNTPAGVIKFVTAKPTQEVDFQASVSAGTFGTVSAQLGYGGPLIEDVLAFRVSGFYQRRGDWVDNGFTGEDNVLGGFREAAGRFQLLYTPTDDFSILGNFHGRSYRGTSALFRANVFTAGSNELNDNFDRDTVFFDGGANNPQDATGLGGSIKVEWDLGPVVLTSITGFEDASSFSLGDIDGGVITPGLNASVPPGLTSGLTDTSFPPDGVVDSTTFPGFIPFSAETQDSVDDLEQFTQEVRIASNNSGPFNWVAGFYYFDTSFDVETVGPAFPPLTLVSHGNESWALFGQLTYDVTDRLNLTGGVRYTEDERTLDAVPPPFVTVNPTSVDDEDFSWDVSALYRLTDDLNVYARVARGYRGPTIQGRDIAFAAFSGAVDPQTVATSETILSYEAGVKTQFLNNRARLNATGYYYTVDDQQFSIIGGLTNSNQVINADEGIGWGFEVDAEALVTDNFFISAGFSYNNTEINDEDLATAPCGSGQCTVLDPLNDLGQALIDGNPFPNAPELTFNVFAEYTYPWQDQGEFFVNTDWAIQGETNFFLYESVEFQSNGNTEGGLRIGYRTQDSRFEGAFFARNLLDAENVRGGIDFNNLTGFVNEPRVVGIQLSVRN